MEIRLSSCAQAVSAQDVGGAAPGQSVSQSPEEEKEEEEEGRHSTKRVAKA